MQENNGENYSELKLRIQITDAKDPTNAKLNQFSSYLSTENL